MSYQQRVTEPKLSKCGLFTTRAVKVGNKVMGHIEVAKTAPGVGIYWGSAEVMRLCLHDDSIHVTRSAIVGLRSYGVVFIGCRFSDGVSYTAPLEACTAALLDRTKPYVAVPRSAWVETLPPEEDRVANTMSLMRLAGGRRKSSMTASL